jgi:2-amino-4-hydroxy-6-hydroxymethyldihydropteridine diphosphokinase
MVTCYLGVGSNLGNRRKNIRLAIKKINSLKSTKVIKTSRIFKTKPAGGPAGQRNYLNGVIKIRTLITPSPLLKELKKIEKDLGRKKTVRYGPRTIDLDILFYADRIINSKSLQVPHPKIFEREFVLRPLLEVI